MAWQDCEAPSFYLRGLVRGSGNAERKQFPRLTRRCQLPKQLRSHPSTRCRAALRLVSGKGWPGRRAVQGLQELGSQPGGGTQATGIREERHGPATVLKLASQPGLEDTDTELATLAQSD